MQSGSELLKQWIERSGYKRQADVAEFFQFKESFLSMLVNGKRVPSLDNAVKIESLTGIPVQAWTSSADDKAVVLVSGDGRKRKFNK
jgi:plasmid maintenance system antidote protein VapI